MRNWRVAAALLVTAVMLACGSLAPPGGEAANDQEAAAARAAAASPPGVFFDLSPAVQLEELRVVTPGRAAVVDDRWLALSWASGCNGPADHVELGPPDANGRRELRLTVGYFQVFDCMEAPAVWVTMLDGGDLSGQTVVVRAADDSFVPVEALVSNGVVGTLPAGALATSLSVLVDPVPGSSASGAGLYHGACGQAALVALEVAGMAVLYPYLQPGGENCPEDGRPMVTLEGPGDLGRYFDGRALFVAAPAPPYQPTPEEEARIAEKIKNFPPPTRSAEPTIEQARRLMEALDMPGEPEARPGELGTGFYNQADGRALAIGVPLWELWQYSNLHAQQLGPTDPKTAEATARALLVRLGVPGADGPATVTSGAQFGPATEVVIARVQVLVAQGGQIVAASGSISDLPRQ